MQGDGRLVEGQKVFILGAPGEGAAAEGIEFLCPSFIFCTDNGAMIGAAGYIDYMRGIRDDLTLNAVPGLPIGAR